MIYSSINIVIPVYNEGENILTTLHEIREKIKTPHKIFIVYDFEEDDTFPVIKKYDGPHEIVLIKNRYGHGALNAIKTGFDSVLEGVVLVVMADASDDLNNVDKMFDKINQGYDIVCGARYMRGGEHIGGPFIKKTMSRLAGVSLHYLTRIPTHDVTNSYKMYTKKLLNDVSIESGGGFELGMEIVIKSFLKGYKIAEVPSTWTDRTSGGSRFKLLRWLPRYLHWYLFAIVNNTRSMLHFKSKSR